MNLRLLEGFDKEVCEWVAASAPFGYADFRPGDRGFAIVSGDRLIAGVVFSLWQPAFSSVEFSGAAVSSYIASPGIVAALGHYAYRQLQANRVWARTATRNTRAIRILRHLGFTPEGTHVDFYGPGLHAGTYRMLKREWDRKYGQQPLKVAA